MNERRMVVDPSLAVVGARRTLRRLGTDLALSRPVPESYLLSCLNAELEAYASVMSAFRAQGPLTG